MSYKTPSKSSPAPAYREDKFKTNPFAKKYKATLDARHAKREALKNRTHAKGTKYLPVHPIHRGEKKEE